MESTIKPYTLFISKDEYDEASNDYLYPISDLITVVFFERLHPKHWPNWLDKEKNDFTLWDVENEMYFKGWDCRLYIEKLLAIRNCNNIDPQIYSKIVGGNGFTFTVERHVYTAYEGSITPMIYRGFGIHPVEKNTREYMLLMEELCQLRVN
jgi:hypothetical protein